MAWYSSGTVNVTNGVPTVTLSGGDALLNISPDDGFVGPDGRTYPILTIGGSGTFTLADNYLGPTASAQDYAIIPVADFNQLRSLLISVNTLITEYQDITLNAGIGLFEVGTASLPGVRANGHEGTGLVWNADGSLSISVNGSIVATFNVGGSDGPVTEAPIDGLYYARMDGGWVSFDPNGGGGGNIPISDVVGLQDALDDKASNDVVTTSANGLMIAADKVKLNGIATGATTNQTDAFLLARANHTGTQAISTVSGLQTALDAKTNSAITITAGTGLTGGGNLTANRTIALSSTSLASLALADSAIQASDLGDLAYVDFPAVPAGNVLNDLGNWVPQSGGGGGSGTVTSVNASGGDTGLTFTGGPITDSGTLTLGGNLNLANLEQGVDGSFVVGRLTTTGNVGRIAATNAATANTIPVRGSGGVVAVGTPTATDHAVTLGFAGATYQALSGKNVANGYAGLDADGKINGSQLPAIAITETFVVASQAAMLALTAQVGDIAVRTDTSQSFVLRVEPATAVGNWTQLLTPASGVTSVAASGGTTGFGFTGGPITSTGTLTLTISNAATARTALGLGTIATLAAPSGSVVGTTGAQTISDKTLTSPVVNGYTEGMATASGTVFSPSLAAGAVFFYTTTGNATITMPAAVAGKSFVIVLQYGGVHTLTWAGTTIRWAGGTAPTPTSVNGKRDTFSFICVDGTSWQNGGMNA